MTAPSTAARLQVFVLPNTRFVVVFAGMPHIGDDDLRDDFEPARQTLLDAGAAAVLRFDHQVEVA